MIKKLREKIVEKENEIQVLKNSISEILNKLEVECPNCNINFESDKVKLSIFDDDGVGILTKEEAIKLHINLGKWLELIE